MLAGQFLCIKNNKNTANHIIFYLEIKLHLYVILFTLLM